MKLLPLLCLLSAGFGPASAGETCNSAAPGVPVAEGEDALLCCDFGQKVVGFHWKKDNGKEENTVFFYDNGIVRDPIDQFSGRVEFFKDELDSGNASIKIRDTRLEDSGTYTCVLVDPGRQEINIRLNVVGVLKIRENVTGAAPEPHINIVDDKVKWRLLECKVKGVPEPEVEWRNSAGEVLTPTEKHESIFQSGRFYVKLTLKVTNSDNYTCVATQRTICHQVNKTMPVSIPVVVAVVEGKDALLPCSPNVKHVNSNLMFSWIKDGYEFFRSNELQVKEDVQFKGRVTANTKSGIASIKIHNTQMSDSGHYSCHIANVLKSNFILQVVEDPNGAATASVSTVVLMVVFGNTIGVL